MGNWQDYVKLVERCRLREGFMMFKIIRDGMAAVLPVELLPLFTPAELETLVSGSAKVDLALLKQCTEYDGLDPQDELVDHFWQVMEEMSDEDKSLFLRFVWARSRMPTSSQERSMNFKIQRMSNCSEDHLPHAQTCFFSLSLPPYSTKEALKEKLLYAISNSPNMDADVRLHSGEGWNDYA
jgi:hypothetical protein